MKKTIATKIGAAAFSGAFAVTGLSATVGMIPVLAAQDNSSPTGRNNDTADTNDLSAKDSDVIDNSRQGKITIYKYDTTSAEAAGEWKEGELKATGQEDTAVSNKLKDYAISGVEFSYLKVGNIETYSTSGENGEVVVVYEIKDDLAAILGLKTDKTFDQDDKGYYPATDVIPGESNAHGCTTAGVHHYTSTQIDDALKAILDADNITAKNALETYLDGAAGKATMPLTNEQGITTKEGLPLGLYLIVETKVPEEVTSTVNPWFISLPFTNTKIQEGASAHTQGSESKKGNAALSGDGGAASGGTTDANNGGDYWLYNFYAYPKNQTGNPTIDKSVRNAYTTETVAETGADGTDNASVSNGHMNDHVTYDASKNYVGANSSETPSDSLVVFNKTDGEHSADTNESTYVANRGGYTQGTGRDAGQGGAGYSTDYKYDDTTTASQGDLLDYILVSKIPTITSKATYLSDYTFKDKLSKGLKYNEDIRIAFYDNADDANVNNTKNAKLIWDVSKGSPRASYATLNEGGKGSFTFTSEYVSGGASINDATKETELTLNLTKAGLDVVNGEVDEAHVAAGTGVARGLSNYYMVVYYTATVNSDATVTVGDNGNKNDVTLIWSRTNTSTFNTLTDRNYVYSYGLDLTKHFSKQEDASAFKDVEFKMYNATDAYYVIAKQDPNNDGVYYVTGKTTDKAQATALKPASDPQGRLNIYGLEADKYQLTETKTHDGYSLLRDQIEIDITPTVRDIKASVAGTTGLDADQGNAIINNYSSAIGMDSDGKLVYTTDENKKGIRNEDDQKVNAGKTDITSNNRNADQSIERSVANGTSATNPNNTGGGSTPNGRTIGKTDMYEGEINSASATIDGKACTMLAGDQTLTADNTSANAEVKLDVTNNKNWLLPATGGMGTYAATIAGIVILGMGLYSINKKKETA